MKIWLRLSVFFLATCFFAETLRAQLYLTISDAFNSADVRFGSVDLSTGAFTQINTLPGLLTGLTTGPGGTLYGSLLAGGFVQVGTNGTLTPFGTATDVFRNFAFSGTNFNGVQLSGTILNLFSLTSNGNTSALVGQMASTFGNLSSDTLEYGPGGTLYFSLNPTPGNPPPAFLYSVNPATGAITQIGSETTVNPLLLAFDGTTLYGVSGAAPTIYSINTATGAATALQAITNLPAGTWNANAGAFAIPEPSTVGLCAVGVVFLTVVARGQRRRRSNHS